MQTEHGAGNDVLTADGPELTSQVVGAGVLPDFNVNAWIRGDDQRLTRAMVSRRRRESYDELLAVAAELPELASLLRGVDQDLLEQLAETPDVAFWSSLDAHSSGEMRAHAEKAAGQKRADALVQAVAREVEDRSPRGSLIINAPFFALQQPLPGLEVFERAEPGVGGIDAALNVLRQQSGGYFDELSTLIRYVTLLKQRRDRIYSGSSSMLPGVVFLTAEADDRLTAEMLVHELAHSKLFLLQRWDALTADVEESEWAGQMIYSPWRTDLRPVQGVLHGAFVFTHVARLWSGLARATGHVGDPDAASVRRAVTAATEVKFAVELLRRNAGFTQWGEDVLSALLNECERINCENVGADERALRAWSPDRERNSDEGPALRELLAVHNATEHNLRTAQT